MCFYCRREKKTSQKLMADQQQQLSAQQIVKN